MKSIADRVVLARRARFSHIASLGGLAILLGGVAVPLWLPDLSALTPYMLIGGFGISNIGIYFANRWVRKPRPEDVLDEGLKTLNNQNRCYHYLLPEDHVLLTASGVVVIETCALDGKFTYRAGRWRQRFSLSRAMRFFVEETLGDPIKRAQAGAAAVHKLIERHVSESIPVDSMVVFTHPMAEYEVEGAPVPVCQPKKLAKRLPQRPKLPPEVVEQVREVLDIAAKVSERGLDED